MNRRGTKMFWRQKCFSLADKAVKILIIYACMTSMTFQAMDSEGAEIVVWKYNLLQLL